MSNEYAFQSNTPKDALLRITTNTLKQFSITLIESSNGAYSEQNDDGWPQISLHLNPPHFSLNFAPRICENILTNLSKNAEAEGWLFTWEEI